MASRPPRRGGGFQSGGRPTMRPTYETFRPRFEWKNEDNATLLLLFLPGFVKEQIRIDVEESNGLLSVQGQRPLGGGRWSLFRQSFVIPPTCDFSQLKTQFELGVLTIIMPFKPPPPPEQQQLQKSEQTDADVHEPKVNEKEKEEEVMSSDDHRTDRDDDTKERNVEKHKTHDVVEKETLRLNKEEEQDCLINVLLSVFVLMGLGAHIFSIVST